MAEEEEKNGEGASDENTGTLKFKNNGGKTVEINDTLGNVQAAIAAGWTAGNKAAEAAVKAAS